MKSAITDIKNSVKGFEGRCKKAGERISKLVDMTMEIIEIAEPNRKMKEKFTETLGSVGP